MRQLAEYLSGKGVASLRYDKVGTGKTGIGPYALHPGDVGSAVYTSGAKAAVRFLAQQPRTDKSRISAYGLGEGTVHAMAVAVDTSPDAPKIHALGLFQPLSARYLDIITGRVRADVESAVSSGAKTRQQGDEVLATWNAAVVEARTTGTAPAKLPRLGAILNPATSRPSLKPTPSTRWQWPPRCPRAPRCSCRVRFRRPADCAAEKPLMGALGHTALTVVELKGVNHVLRDDPTDNVANYAKKDPLSPQLITALDGFVGK
jgi:hypothetical protein